MLLVEEERHQYPLSMEEGAEAGVMVREGDRVISTRVDQQDGVD